MDITVEQFARIFPSAPDPATWAEAIGAAWSRFAFDSVSARAGYLGICGNETGGFTSVRRENMNYSPRRAREVFGSMRASRCVKLCTLDDHGRRVRHDDGEAFANCVYAGMIGNGGPETGDGWRFRGAGIIQLTGRANYAAAAKGIDVPADDIGNLIEQSPTISAAVAAWFMAVYRPQILALLDSDSETDFIAGAALVGHPPPGATERRLAYRRKAIEVLSAAPLKPRDLRRGDKGADVEMLQAALNNRLSAGLKVDGDFGPRTYNAVIAWQDRCGIRPADGVVNVETRKSLGLEA